jgi:hypothetical protein
VPRLSNSEDQHREHRRPGYGGAQEDVAHAEAQIEQHDGNQGAQHGPGVVHRAVKTERAS